MRNKSEGFSPRGVGPFHFPAWNTASAFRICTARSRTSSLDAFLVFHDGAGRLVFGINFIAWAYNFASVPC
jgi:hypothetical protein